LQFIATKWPCCKRRYINKKRTITLTGAMFVIDDACAVIEI